MNRHHLLSPSVDMVQWVADLLLENKPLSRSLAVFPGKRPGYFLHKYLADRLKTAFIPPRILAMDEFIEQIADDLSLAGQMVDAVDCLAAIYKMNDKSRVIAQNRPALTLDEFLPWGNKLFNDFEELYIEEIAPETLKTVETLIEDKLPTGIRSKLNALSDLYESFYEYIEKKGLTTRSYRYRQTADRIEKATFDSFDHIYCCGFFFLTGAEKRIFRHLAQDDRFQFVFQDGPGIDRIIADLGIKPVKTGDEPTAPRIHFHKAMDSHAEIFGLNEVIRNEKDLGPRDVIVVPMPDALFPIVHSTLGFVKDYNISMGYPIYRTPLNTLINALARLRETKQGDDYPVADYMRFVLHPYVKNIYLDRASYPGRIIFHTIEEIFTKNQQRFLSLSDLEQDQELLDDCVGRLRGLQEGAIDQGRIKEHLKQIHDVLIRPFEDIRDIADLTEKIIKVISFISNESPANEHPFTMSFIKAMIDGLHELQTSGLGPEKLAAPDRYFRLISTYVRSIKHPFSGTPVKGLQVLGFLETRNIKFDRVFLLDVNEGILPSTSKEDTTLPYAVRKAIKLTIPEDRERISRYYFETLVSGSRQADIFYVEGADKEKSRLVERLIWDIQKKNGKLDYPTEDIYFKVQFTHADPEPIKKTALFRDLLKNGLTFSASSLNDYLKCPLFYYYKKFLGLKLKEGVAEDPDVMGIGGIVHEILMRFFIPKIGKPLQITRADYQRMDKVIEEKFREDYPDADRGSVYLIKSQTKRRLREFLRFHEEDERFQNTKILECENVTASDQKPPEDSIVKADFPLNKKHTVAVNGYIDRVDERDGMIQIIDYKTGTSGDVPNYKKFDLKKREEWPDTLISVQLPMYIILYLGNHHDVKIENINAGLLIMGGKNFVEKWLFNKKLSTDARVGLFDTYRQAIATLIEEIRDPDRDFVPTADEDNCAGCDFQTLCGRQWVVKTW